MLINYSANIINRRDEITNEVNSLISIIKDNTEINRMELFILSLKRNYKIILSIWLLGCTIIGEVLIYAVILYEGFTLGYTISALIAVLGIRNGLLFSLMALLIQNIVFIPTVFFISEKGIEFCKKTYKKNAYLKQEIIKYTIMMFISILLMTISSFFETYISINILMFFKEII